LLFSQCKKINVPDPELNKIFGKWKLVCTSSWGGGCDPIKDPIWIEFKKNGHYEWHEKGHLPIHDKFTFIEDKDYAGNTIYIIKFNKGSRLQNWYFKNDTLLLYDWHVYDGGSSAYIPK
jgi:hypothetical protein